jgi:large conductance mechanosensitive channel
MKDFKEFLLRGNLVTMAVAFVIGLAFADVIKAFVTDIITPIIAAIGGNPDFSALNFTINGSIFSYGAFFNAVITFFVIAAVIFFFVVKPYNAFAERTARDVPETEKECPHCLSAIPLEASVCSHCTRDVASASV